MLVISAIMLVFLIIVVILVTVITRNITKQAATRSAPVSSQPTPVQLEKSIYLDLPGNFPKDLPLPKQVKVTVSGEDEVTRNAVLSTAANLDDIVSFYLKELPGTGWEITNQTQAGGLTIIYTAKENREVIIAIGKGEEGVAISITVLKHTP